MMSIEEPVNSPVPTALDHPLWRLGFRPFYLLAAAFAALAMPLWMASYFGALPGWGQLGVAWHMHEMVFGMAIAVIIGFLYTAGRTWTGLWTPTKGHLAALAALWLAGRLAMLFAPAALAAVVDLLFLPIAAWPLYQVLARSGNRRNLFLIVLLGLLALANAVFHGIVLGQLTLVPTWAPTLPIHAAILIIVVIESVIGARVIPMFTRNGAPGSNPVVHPLRDKIALALMVSASLAWVAGLAAPVVALLAAGAAFVTLLRLIGWQPQRTLGVPMLWILHLSYAWIPIGFFLLALAALKLVSASAAFHALTVGSMAGLILGMMSRTALGHTGRPLLATRLDVAMYGLIQIGAILRVAAAFDAFGMRNAALLVSTVCWSAAFLLYLIAYGPFLWRPRIDGREG
jgi:uncharacterized protein involved in response to NO